MSNAIKYSHSGQLLISCGLKDSHILITIEDEGPGISAEDANRIFDAFYRPDSSRTNGTDGSGLGLAVVSSIIKAHGGSVQYRSSRLGGSCFELVLPIVDR